MSGRSTKEALLLAAQQARERSYSPYSKFRVGAAVLLKSGRTLLGANIENASYGVCICAERTALVNYASSPEMYHAKPKDEIVAIAVSSDLDEPCSPCGICRQFIREFAALDTPILMVNTSWKPRADAQGAEGVNGLREEETGVTIRTLEQLLPLSFGPEQLGK